MSNPDELIAQFIEISGGEEESVARFYLSSSNWSLEDALANFLGNQNSDEDTSNAANGSAAKTATADTPAPTARASAVKQEPASSATGKASSNKPKFATLSDMFKGDSSDEEGQAFYAGGSERSGQQVLGPPKHRKDLREQLNKMFRMAQEHSADRDPGSQPSTSSGITWGQGMRLGMTTSDHAAVGVAKKKDTAGKGPVVILKLWSQGFSVDNGELRLYNDPANKEFLETVTRGEIPNELLEMGWMVNVEVEDHRHEEYKGTTVVRTFRGSGHTLGSPVPNIVGETTSSSNSTVVAAPTSSATTAKTEVDTKDKEEAAKKALNVNNNAETTTIQIRLTDGTRLTAQFNLTHTIADIQQYIRNARPQYANSNFLLVSSFPTRELKDTTVTIAESNLKNAAILQRII